jgi:hypothetical protein
MHKTILRRVGLVLVLANLVQLAWTAYLATRTYSFSFDFTFLVAGIAMMFGSLSFAHFIRRIAAFLLGAMLAFAAYWIVASPPSLLLAELRLQTWETLGELASYILDVLFCAWTVRELSRPEILSDAPNHSFAWITPKVAFAGGAALLLALGAFLLPLGYGETGARAVREASAGLGPSFRYHLTALSIDYENGTKHVSGMVMAWNDLAVVEVPFAWDE